MIHVDDALWFLMEKDPGLTPYSGEIRINMDNVYYAQDTEFGYGIRLYLPCRSGAALEKVAW